MAKAIIDNIRDHAKSEGRVAEVNELLHRMSELRNKKSSRRLINNLQTTVWNLLLNLVYSGHYPQVDIKCYEEYMAEARNREAEQG